MRSGGVGIFCALLLVTASFQSQGQLSSPTSNPQVPQKQRGPSASSGQAVGHPAIPLNEGIDAGTVSAGVYRDKALGVSCRIPAGWVLRTEEMNAREGDETGPASPSGENSHISQKQGDMGHPHSGGSGRVLLAAFSRPPEAKGEEVNSSILIAVESVAAYPGLKEAAQYFGPLTEVAKAQGFTVDEEPYEIAVGTRVLARGDFHKDVGTRVMRQATLVMLARGYVVSFTFIAGTEDEVEELIDGLELTAEKTAK
jgi:hypothetical protein